MLMEMWNEEEPLGNTGWNAAAKVFVHTITETHTLSLACP